MLTPKKKITKKELKQDTLISSYAKVTAWYYQNKKTVHNAIFGVIIVIVAVAIYVYNRGLNEEKAATALGKVIAIYDAAATDPRQYKIAIDGQPERGTMGLKAIVENYGGTNSGEIARFYLANAYYYTGQIDQAIEQFDDFNGNDKFLQASAYAGLGSCYESKGLYDKAAGYYEKAAGAMKNENQVAEYLIAAGRCYGLAGAKEKALSFFERVKREFPTSALAKEVDRYIAQFSA
jgi:tetratricopeptide (TPR) repeat protein